MINELIEKAASCRHDECCKNQFCLECGSHVSTYNCNTDLVAQRPNAASWDWWVACDNAECEHAVGEGLFQDPPDWLADKSRLYYCDVEAPP